MKSMFVLCALALFIQAISGQCIGYGASSALPVASASCGRGNGLVAGLSNNLAIAGSSNAIANTNGGAFTVSISSPLAPSSVSVLSENDIQGSLAVEGQLPFLAAVALEGQVPSSGSGGVSYSCGSSNNVGIVSQGQVSGQSYGSRQGYGAGTVSSVGAGSLAELGGLSSGCGCGRY